MVGRWSFLFGWPVFRGMFVLGEYCTGAVGIEFHDPEITTNQFLTFLPKTRSCFDSGLLMSNKDVLYVHIPVHKSTSRSWLTHACCSPVFLRETSVMKYKNLQYKYPLQQESFECLSNAVQLRICTINISQWKYMGVSKNCGVSPKMDGENNGKPYFNGWFGGKTHYFRKHPFLQSYSTHSFSPESFHESFHVVKQVKAHKAKALNLDKCYVWGFFESLDGLTKIPGVWKMNVPSERVEV